MKFRINKIRYSKTFYKIFICLLFSIVSILIFLASVLYINFEKQAIKTITNYNDRSIQQVTNNINSINSMVRNFINKQILNQDIVYLMYTTDSNTFQTEQIINKLQDQFGIFSVIHSAFIYNNRTKTYHYLLDKQVAKETTKTLSKMGTIPIMRPVPNETINSDGVKQVIFTYYTYEYTNSSLETEGLIGVNIKSDIFTSNFDTTKVENANFVILDKSGKIVVDSKNIYNFGSIIDRDYMKNLLSEKDFESSFVTGAGNEKKIITFRKIENTDWYMMCEQPYSAVESFLNSMRSKTIIVTLIILLLGLILVAFITTYIYTPIGNLVKNTTLMFKDINTKNDDLVFLKDVFEDNSNKIKRYENQQKIAEILFKENYFKSILSGGKVVLDQQSQNILPQIDDKKMFIILFKLSDKNDVLNAKNIKDYYVKQFNTSYQDAIIEGVVTNRAEVVIILALNDCDSLNVKKDMEIETSYSCFISNCFDYADISEKYILLKNISRYTAIYGQNCMLNENTALSLENSGDSLLYPTNIEERIIVSLKQNKIDIANENLKKFLQTISKGSINKFNGFLMQFVLKLQNLNSVSSFSEKYKLDLKFDDFYSNIDGINGIDDIYTYISSCFNELELDANKPMVSKNSVLVKAIKEYLDAEYPNAEISLKSVSDLFKHSSIYLGRLFKEQSGLSLNDYLNKIRLEKSAELLLYSHFNISEIMYKVGFLNESNFYRQFKKVYGVTPKEYRINNLD